MSRFNKVYWGLLVGLLCPLLALLMIYAGVDHNIDLTDIDHFKLNMKLISPFLRLSLLPICCSSFPLDTNPKYGFYVG